MDLPTNFATKLDVLQNYTKAPVRIIPSTGQQEISAGDTTIFTLPICVQDLRTFRLNFVAETVADDAKIAGFPQFMPCMIEQLDIYVNGTSIQHIPYYNQVYKLMKDWSISFEEALFMNSAILL